MRDKRGMKLSKLLNWTISTQPKLFNHAYVPWNDLELEAAPRGSTLGSFYCSLRWPGPWHLWQICCTLGLTSAILHTNRNPQIQKSRNRLCSLVASKDPRKILSKNCPPKNLVNENRRRWDGGVIPGVIQHSNPRLCKLVNTVDKIPEMH